MVRASMAIDARQSVVGSCPEQAQATTCTMVLGHDLVQPASGQEQPPFASGRSDQT